MNSAPQAVDRFTIVRLALALAVVVSHAFSVGNGSIANEPLHGLTGLTLGEHAVNMFFAVSGYLVTMSFQRRGWRDYVLARALRIGPGLVGAIMLCAFVLGPVLSALEPGAYFANGQLWRFVAQAMLSLKSTGQLPGVFETNPFRFPLGTIWTLKYEIYCYLAVLGIGLSGGLRRPLLVVTALAGLAVLRVILDATGRGESGALATGTRLFLCFGVGAMLHLLADRIPLSWLAAGAALLGAIALSRMAGGPTLIFVAESYAVIVAARAPLTSLPGVGFDFASRTDLSYGVYLYGWPVQQTIQQLVPAWPLGVALPVATAVTLIVAWLSWRLIEKPALDVKGRMMGTRGDQPRRAAA